MADYALGRLRPEDAQRRAHLVELREKAVVAQAAAEAHAPTSYLWGNLPVEILVEIFTLLIVEDHTWAVRLSHVCGHWRRILINTPSAWQTLVLSRKHPVEKAKLWKQRAKNRIARITFAMSPLDRASVFSQLQDLSWDDLSSLRISCGAFVDLRRKIPQIPLPHMFSKLDELTLLDCAFFERLPCDLSSPSWKLEVLHLSGAVNMMDEWWQRIQQLKEFRLTGTVTRFSTLVFAANPLLERLALDCPKIEEVSPNRYNDAPLTSMENLKWVECRGIRNPFDVLHAITAPSITHFGMFTAATMADETLLHMASRPSLVELHITDCSLSPSTLPTLLSSTPNLEILRVNTVYGVVNEVFQFLTPKTADSLPCRALKHIDVSWCPDLTTSNLYAFVKTRTQYASESVGSAEKCATIVSLEVDGCWNIESDMLPWFRSKVARFNCIYSAKNDFKKNRRRNL